MFPCVSMLFWVNKRLLTWKLLILDMFDYTRFRVKHLFRHCKTETWLRSDCTHHGSPHLSHSLQLQSLEPLEKDTPVKNRKSLTSHHYPAVKHLWPYIEVKASKRFITLKTFMSPASTKLSYTVYNIIASTAKYTLLLLQCPLKHKIIAIIFMVSKKVCRITYMMEAEPFITQQIITAQSHTPTCIR